MRRAAAAPRVVLIGYRGTGKTTVSRLLAERAGAAAFDTDRWIEQTTGRSIRDIFQQDGEPAFRALEAQAVCAARDSGAAFVSVGGGAVLSAENRAVLREIGRVVWLTGDAPTLAARLGRDPRNGSDRPALTDRPPLDEIEALLKVRTPHYRALAAFEVDTTTRTPAEVADEVLRTLGGADQG